VALDNDDSNVNVSSHTEPSDSGVAGNPSVGDSQSDPTPAADGASADIGAPAASQSESGQPGSLTTEDTQPSKQIEATIEKRFKDTQASFHKERQQRQELERQHQTLQQQLAQYQQRLQGIDPQEFEKFRQSRQQVPVWNPKSPEHAKFKRAIQAAQMIEMQLQGIDDPQERAIATKYATRVLSDEDRRMLSEYRDHSRNVRLEMETDPDGYLESRFQRMFQEQIGSWQQNLASTYQQSTKAEADVKKWFDENKEVAETQREYLGKRLSEGVPWDIARLEAEKAHLLSKMSSANNAAKSAEEKERLLRGSASSVVSHDPKAPTAVDPIKVAKERGIDLSDRGRYYDLIRELQQSGQLPA